MILHLIRVTNQRDVDQWNFIWNTLTRVTGLRLNPAKTQILLLGGEQHRSDLTLVQQIGVVSSSVTHLGVIHAADHHESSRLTYDALIPKVEKAVNLFINAASHADLLHRSMLIRSLINSQLLHIFRVYPPSKQQLSKLDSLVRSAMWSKKFEGTPYGRVKVARDRVHAPINKGGLDLALPSVSALHAFYGSLTALLKHAVNSTSSMLNVIHQITAKHANAVNLMGSKSMRSCLPWLSKLISSSEDSLERLVELLRAIELDPRTAFRASVWGSAYSQFSSISANRFAEKYPQLLSVYQLLNRPQAKKNTPIELNDSFALLPSNDRIYLQTVISSVKANVKIFSPFRNIRLPALNIFLYAIQVDNSFLKNCDKRFRKNNFNSVPPSYYTRIRDGVDAPRDVAHFCASYSFLKHAKIESMLKSFQFEVLGRTLLSSNKRFIFQQTGNNICPVCPNRVIASSAHIIADCIIPTFFIKIFNSFAPTCPETAKLRLDTVNFEFGFHQPKCVSAEVNEQLQHIFFSIKKLALEAHKEPRLARWTHLVHFAKILTKTRRVAIVRRYAHLPFDTVDRFVDFLINQQEIILLIR